MGKSSEELMADVEGHLYGGDEETSGYYFDPRVGRAMIVIAGVVLALGKAALKLLEGMG